MQGWQKAGETCLLPSLRLFIMRAETFIFENIFTS